MIAPYTTTITVERPSGGDIYDPDTADATVVSTGTRAHISAPSGRANTIGGEQEAVELRLYCPIIDLVHTDIVIDETTDERFQVVWKKQRNGLGLDHIVAGLKLVDGLA